MKKKRFFGIRLAALLLACLLTVSCGKTNGAAQPPAEDSAGAPVIVTTIFPLYDWVKNIAGEETDAELTLLLDNGVDLHSFQPTAQDVMKIATCDLFLYVGGESDDWVEDALKEAVNPDMIVINLLEALGSDAKEEEHAEGMEEDHDHDHGEAEPDNDGEDHDDHEDHEDSGNEFDEHIWLSLRNAEKLCGVIADALASADPENAEQYGKNLAAYREQLDALDKKYEDAVAQAPVKTLLFADRFPFRYLTDDYGLSYYAAFPGCSAETEASFETVAFLSGKMDELNLSRVVILEGTDGKMAQTVIGNTSAKDQRVVTLNSLQSVTGQAVAEGASYLAIMEQNLEQLKEALQ